MAAFQRLCKGGGLPKAAAAAESAQSGAPMDIDEAVVVGSGGGGGKSDKSEAGAVVVVGLLRKLLTANLPWQKHQPVVKACQSLFQVQWGEGRRGEEGVGTVHTSRGRDCAYQQGSSNF